MAGPAKISSPLTLTVRVSLRLSDPNQITGRLVNYHDLVPYFNYGEQRLFEAGIETVVTGNGTFHRESDVGRSHEVPGSSEPHKRSVLGHEYHWPERVITYKRIDS